MMKPQFFVATLIAACVSQTLVASAGAADRVLQAQQQRVEVMRQAAATTVAVFDGSGEGGGSGVVISPDGFVLTNFHVTAGCGAAMKCGLDDGKIYDAVIVGIDPVGDVALIQLLGRDDFPHCQLGDSDTVEVGDWVFTAGNPFLLADNFQPSIAYGMVSGVQRYQYPAGTLLEYADCIQTDAAINPGNSGGPLFDDSGRLVGINGRGSFEKRGRVNVGVGYAISINQIRRFLPHLRSGRIVDHATLGATVSTAEGRRVKVDEILETCDAYRRGLRYGDQIVHFAGREITTANRLKNALGIFPRGWLVPMIYRRDGESFETTVRLMGVHDQSQLYDLVQRQASNPVEPPGGDLPQPDGPDSDGPEQEAPVPRQRKRPSLVQKKTELPAIVASRYVARRGYANYWYNQQNQLRLWNGYSDRQSLASSGPAWQLRGELVGGGEMILTINSQQATVALPQAISGATFSANATAAGQAATTDAEWDRPMSFDLATQLSPPNSGGLLLTLHLWQRLLDKGLQKYGEVYYLGQLPSRFDGALVDCLIGIYAGIETCFQFDTGTGDLVSIVMQPREEADPCELSFSDFGEISGQRLPRRWQVRNGDKLAVDVKIVQWQFDANLHGGKH